MISDEKKAELDAVATERAASLGLPHVVDGPQPYHANFSPTESLPSAADLDTVAEDEKAAAETGEQSNG